MNSEKQATSQGNPIEAVRTELQVELAIIEHRAPAQELNAISGLVNDLVRILDSMSAKYERLQATLGKVDPNQYESAADPGFSKAITSAIPGTLISDDVLFLEGTLDDLQKRALAHMYNLSPF